MNILPVTSRKHAIVLILLEKVSKRATESMLDLDSTCVSDGCAMVCTELQYEDASKDEVV